MQTFSFPAPPLWLMLHIIVCWIFKQFPFLIKPRPVAGAIPRPLLRIPLQCAAQMGAARHCRFQQIAGRFQNVCDQLRMQTAALGRKRPCIGTLLPQNLLCQHHRRHHSRCHAPFIKTCGHVQFAAPSAVLADIGNTVQCHAVLRCPAVFQA